MCTINLVHHAREGYVAHDLRYFKCFMYLYYIRFFELKVLQIYNGNLYVKSAYSLKRTSTYIYKYVSFLGYVADSILSILYSEGTNPKYKQSEQSCTHNMHMLYAHLCDHWATAHKAVLCCAQCESL